MSTISRAIERAYQVAKQRNWNTIYWCLDLHGTVLKSNYSNSGFQFDSPQVAAALQRISNFPETKIILWSSIHSTDLVEVLELFKQNDIQVHYVNENPEVPNTQTGNFTDKFYFSVLVDDKAGFDPTEWCDVAVEVEHFRQIIL